MFLLRFSKLNFLGERDGDLKGFIGVIAERKAIDMFRKLSKLIKQYLLMTK